MKHTLIIAALVTALGAQAHTLGGQQLVPVAGTLRTGATIDMLWLWTDDTGETSEQRLAVTGCGQDHGELYMVEEDYSLSLQEAFPWRRGSELGAIALTMCAAAGQ